MEEGAFNFYLKKRCLKQRKEINETPKNSPALIKNLTLAVCNLVSFCVPGEGFKEWDDMTKVAEERERCQRHVGPMETGRY